MEFMFIRRVNGKPEKGNKIYAVGHVRKDSSAVFGQEVWIETDEETVTKLVAGKLYSVNPVVNGRYVSYTF